MDVRVVKSSLSAGSDASAASEAAETEWQKQ
jgi:hypothetical protein